MTDLPTLHVHYTQKLSPENVPPADVLDPTRESGFDEQTEGELLALYRAAMDSRGDEMEVTVELRYPGDDEPATSIGEFAARNRVSGDILGFGTAASAEEAIALSLDSEQWEVVSRVVFLVDGDRYEGPWKSTAELMVSLSQAAAVSEKQRTDELAGPR
jgi:hypothetical protein